MISGKGIYGSKIMAVRDEMMEIKIPKTPMAFMVLNRMLLELSLKYYATLKNINIIDPKNNQEHQVTKIIELCFEEIINDVSGKVDLIKKRNLNPSIIELRKKDSIFGLTSMNQIVHNNYHTVSSSDACLTFSNSFPFIEELLKA